MTALLESVEDERDRGLVERYQAGDDAAFGELYALHYGRLIRFCRRHVRDPHLAEEIAQDAFLRAYQAMGRLQGERRFYPWLTVIARRLIIDHVRRYGRVQPAAEVDPGQASAADELVVKRLDGDQVLAALDRVRGRHREVLRMRDWEGLSYGEIAQRLGVSPTAVAPLLHRARAALRREFLALTEGRVAALLNLPGSLMLGRRFRDRVALYSSWLPEPSAYSAPLAGVALTLGALAFSIDGGGEPIGSNSGEAGNGVAAGMLVPEAAAQEFIRSREQRPAPQTPGDAGSDAGPVVVPGVAAVQLNRDPEGTRRVDERGRHQPIFIDGGPLIGISSNPDEDRRSLQGMVDRASP